MADLHKLLYEEICSIIREEENWNIITHKKSYRLGNYEVWSDMPNSKYTWEIIKFFKNIGNSFLDTLQKQDRFYDRSNKNSPDYTPIKCAGRISTSYVLQDHKYLSITSCGYPVAVLYYTDAVSEPLIILDFPLSKTSNDRVEVPNNAKKYTFEEVSNNLDFIDKVKENRENVTVEFCKYTDFYLPLIQKGRDVRP